MSFLSPWFLIGAALIGGPILAHLIRRATRTRVTFSAMRFLNPSPPKLDRRNRVQHPWLLLLRCLVVMVLAAGFARPFFKKDLPSLSTPVIPQSVVAVLDESASMQRVGLWDAARTKIYDLVDKLGPGDQFVLLGASDSTTELISHERWKQTATSDRATLVRTVLADRKPGWGPKNLDSAIESATSEWEQMSESANAVTRKKVVVVSDFTNSARVAGLAGLSWPKGSEVNLETVTPTHAGDTGLQWLGWSTDSDTNPGIRVRVVQSEKSSNPDLQIQLRDARTNQAIGDPLKITVEAKDSEVVLVPVPKNAAANPLKIDLTGDEEPYDNTVYAVRPTPREMTLTYYGNHTAKDIQHPRFYVERAVAGWKDPLVHVVAGNATTASTPSSKPAAEFSLVAGPLEATSVDALRKKLEAGSFAIVLLNDPTMVDTAAALAGETGWKPVKPARDDVMFGQIDFQNPLFSIFADPHYSDFTHIQFWHGHAQSVQFSEKTAAVVAAHFEDGLPAVMEVPVGKGRLVIWGGDWEPSASQWVLSTKFVPWLQALFERAAGGAMRPAVAEIGDTARLLGGEAAKWRPLSAPDSEFSENTPTVPGVYQIEQSGSTRWVALQVPAAASDIAPMPMENWEKMGVPLHATPLTSATPLIPAIGEDQTAPVLEARQKLWRWLLLGAVILLALESIYSLALARRAEHNPNEVSA